uniref:Uncharacterized protein n=1 Tax=Salmo trutta TaxID=8032 RepID=A0A674B177_SALTR
MSCSQTNFCSLSLSTLLSFSLFTPSLSLCVCLLLPLSMGMKVVPCRLHWHQTGSQAIFSIYAKNSLPELSNAESNSTTVHTKHRPLGGGGGVTCSVVNMMAVKVEISMRKEEPITWAHLDLPSPTDTHT